MRSASPESSSTCQSRQQFVQEWQEKFSPSRTRSFIRSECYTQGLGVPRASCPRIFVQCVRDRSHVIPTNGVRNCETFREIGAGYASGVNCGCEFPKGSRGEPKAAEPVFL